MGRSPAAGSVTARMPRGSCAKRATGTVVRFWPELDYFDSPRLSLQHAHF